MATYHWLCTQIIVDDSNEHLYFAAKYGAGAFVDYIAHIPHGTYDSIADLITAIGTAMGTADTGGAATYTWTRSGSTGKVSVKAENDGVSGLRLNCDLTTNAIWADLGFNTGSPVSDTSAPYSITSDNKSKHSWFMTRGPAIDTFDRPRVIGAESVITASGLAERVSWGDHTTRDLQWKVVPLSKFLTAYASTNDAFEDVWEEMAHGLYVSYFTSDGSTTFTLLGKYALECQPMMMLDGPRLAPGAAFYDTPLLKLVRQ